MNEEPKRHEHKWYYREGVPSASGFAQYRECACGRRERRFGVGIDHVFWLRWELLCPGKDA